MHLFYSLAHKKRAANATRDVKTSNVRIATISYYLFVISYALISAKYSWKYGMVSMPL
jgi:hypothetical protein